MNRSALILCVALCAFFVAVAAASPVWPPFSTVEDSISIEVEVAAKYGYKPSKKAHHKKSKHSYYEADDEADSKFKVTCKADNSDVVVGGPADTQCPPSPNPNPEDCTPIPRTCPDEAPDCGDDCTPRCPPGQYNRFGAEQVAAHYEKQPAMQMADVRHTTYECVDARGDNPMLGTPGGDLAEVMAATMALIKVRGAKTVTKAVIEAAVDEMFAAFEDNVVDAARGLYFHTDDGRMRNLFVYLEAQLGYHPSIFPFEGPSGREGDIWIEALKRPEFNGCGHIRLMLDAAVSEYYSVNLASDGVANCVDVENAAACIDSKVVAAKMIDDYFRYWWFTAPASKERRQTSFAVEGVLGSPLLGAAVAVVGNSPAGACPHQAPLVRPNFGGSQVFVYHGAAVADWRDYVSRTGLASLIPEGKIDAFIAAWNAIAGQQLGATLAFLPPANNIGIFTVDVPVKEGAHAHHSL